MKSRYYSTKRILEIIRLVELTHIGDRNTIIEELKTYFKYKEEDK